MDYTSSIWRSMNFFFHWNRTNFQSYVFDISFSCAFNRKLMTNCRFALVCLASQVRSVNNKKFESIFVHCSIYTDIVCRYIRSLAEKWEEKKSKRFARQTHSRSRLWYNNVYNENTKKIIDYSGSLISVNNIMCKCLSVRWRKQKYLIQLRASNRASVALMLARALCWFCFFPFFLLARFVCFFFAVWRTYGHEFLAFVARNNRKSSDQFRPT